MLVATGGEGVLGPVHLLDGEITRLRHAARGQLLAGDEGGTLDTQLDGVPCGPLCAGRAALTHVDASPQAGAGGQKVFGLLAGGAGGWCVVHGRH